MSSSPSVSALSPQADAPKSNRAALAVLFGSLVIVMLGFGIAIPLMPFYITHFNASGTALGLMIALYSFMQFLFAPLWGRLSDRIGRKPVLLIGIAGFAGAFFLQGIAQTCSGSSWRARWPACSRRRRCPRPWPTSPTRRRRRTARAASA